jgi:hypothetical protein
MRFEFRTKYFLVVLTFAAMIASAWGQGPQGRILGTVTDASGAAEVYNAAAAVERT